MRIRVWLQKVTEESRYKCVCRYGLCTCAVIKWIEPGIKQRPIQQGAIIVVSNVVGHLHLPGADGGRVIGLDLDAVLGVPHIKQQDIKVENGIRGDEVTCTRGDHRRYL